MIDTLETVNALKANGFSDAQATAIVRIVNKQSQQLASKEDVGAIRKDIQDIQQEVKEIWQEMKEIRQEMKGIRQEVKGIRQEVKEEVRASEERIEKRFKIHLWLIGICITLSLASVSGIIAILMLLVQLVSTL